MKNYKKFKTELLAKPGVNKAYKELGPEFAVIEALIEGRLKRGMTQAQLARRIGTKQSAIARLESGTYNPTLSFLRKVTGALGAQLSISVRS
ncbi:MAG: helix-turn-helix transcriptional regulator [bacterium]|nr:helix-turn-helix transcriptional regulator [bacterium]